MRRILAITILLLAHVGCKRVSQSKTRTSNTFSGQTTKCLGIVNGQKTTDFPSVVYLANEYGACTGTFVGNNVLLTAAHCVSPDNKKELYFIDANKVGDDLSEYDATKAKKVLYNGNAGGEPDLAMNQNNELEDFAIIIFPRNSAPAISEIHATPVPSNVPGTLVGYGLSDFPNEEDAKGAGTKRVGINNTVMAERNVLQQLRIDERMTGVLAILGNPIRGGKNAPHQGSLASSGDSGGPLFVNNKIAGIASWVSWDPELANVGATVYVDLNSAASKALFERAKTEGAEFGSPTPGTVPVPAPTQTPPPPPGC